jgi:hypothetical protein
VHESDHDRHLAAGAGDPTAPHPNHPLDDLVDPGGPGAHPEPDPDPGEATGDAPPSPDLVQAVADFLDDLVDAIPEASPDAPPGQGNDGISGGGETHGGSPDVDARGGLGIDITTITGARGGLGISDQVGSVADPGHPHPHKDGCAVVCRCGSSGTRARGVFGDDG